MRYLALLVSLALATLAARAPSSLASLASSNEAPLELAVRIIGLTGPDGNAALDTVTATQLLENVSRMYAKAGCPIRFELESFRAVDPDDYNLPYETRSMDELDEYRSRFDDGKSLLIVDTGPWSPAMHPANAWTAMPGDASMGTVMESSVAGFFPIVGHELGHYLGLNHVDDPTNMMNPIIGAGSTAISDDQCDQMRQTARSALSAARR